MKLPITERVQVINDCIVQGATTIKYSNCDGCDNLHVTFYNEDKEPFAYATISMEDLDNHLQSIRILRNDILARRAEPLNSREDLDREIVKEFK